MRRDEEKHNGRGSVKVSKGTGEIENMRQECENDKKREKREDKRG